MADTFTAILNLTKPEVGASTDTWGTKVNADLDTLDGLFQAGPALKLANGGTGATTAAGARTNLGLGSDATGSNLSALTNAATARTNLGLGSDATGSNLSALTNAATARTNLALGAMATVASVTLNGDLSGTGTSTISATLANSGVAAGTYTSATVTVDAKGRVTGASSGGGGGVTSLNGQTGAVVDTTLYAIGSYVTARPKNLTNYTANSTIAGSSLWSGSAAVTAYDAGYGTVLFNLPNLVLVNTGSWRCMSPANSNSVNTSAYLGLWVRYA